MVSRRFRGFERFHEVEFKGLNSGSAIFTEVSGSGIHGVLIGFRNPQNVHEKSKRI